MPSSSAIHDGSMLLAMATYADRTLAGRGAGVGALPAAPLALAPAGWLAAPAPAGAAPGLAGRLGAAHAVATSRSSTTTSARPGTVNGDMALSYSALWLAREWTDAVVSDRPAARYMV